MTFIRRYKRPLGFDVEASGLLNKQLKIRAVQYIKKYGFFPLNLKKILNLKKVRKFTDPPCSVRVGAQNHRPIVALEPRGVARGVAR